MAPGVKKGHLTGIFGRRISKFIRVYRQPYADLATIDWRIGEAGHEFQLDLQGIRFWIAAIYRLKSTGWMVGSIRHEHLGSVIGRVILKKV